MKKIGIIAIMLLFAYSSFAQLKFDLGIKGGVNFSKVSFDVSDYSAESVTKTHFGAFGRIGVGRLFVQPELYFSGKGGDVTNITETITSFNYKTFDIPVLLGFRIIKGKPFDLHLVAGPVFSKITSDDLSSGDMFNQSYYQNHYMAIQYGVGIDVLFLTFDARMENGLGDFYDQPNAAAGKNQTFMLSVGFKFL